MSSHFSRNISRVQPLPKICRSKRRLPANFPTTWPPNAIASSITFNGLAPPTLRGLTIVTSLDGSPSPDLFESVYLVIPDWRLEQRIFQPPTPTPRFNLLLTWFDVIQADFAGEIDPLPASGPWFQEAIEVKNALGETVAIADLQSYDSR